MIQRRKFYCRPVHIYFKGESNTGGQASNAVLTAGELAPTPLVRHFNNVTEQFEDLQIGVNNNLLHGGGGINSTMHGWELGIKHRVEMPDFPKKYLPINLTKCGSGGSTASQWLADSENETTFRTRAIAVRSKLVDPYVFVWYHQGFNDIDQGTDLAIWKTQTLAILTRDRAFLGAGTHFIVPYYHNQPALNDLWDEIADEIPNVHMVSITGAPMADGYHWTSLGYKMVGINCMNKTIEILDQLELAA